MKLPYKIQRKIDLFLCKRGFHKMGKWLEMEVLGYKTRFCKRSGGCGHSETIDIPAVAPKIEPLMMKDCASKTMDNFALILTPAKSR